MAGSTCPILETSRLVLAAHTRADFDALHTLWADPAITRYIGAKPSTPAESWSRLLRYRVLWPILGYGYWAIREKSTGRYAGDVGFADFHCDAEPPIAGIPEAGWVLATWAQGCGFASEAVAAALAWLDQQTTYRRVLALIEPENAPSIRVATKNGFIASEPLRLAGDVISCWQRLQ